MSSLSRRKKLYVILSQLLILAAVGGTALWWFALKMLPIGFYDMVMFQQSSTPDFPSADYYGEWQDKFHKTEQRGPVPESGLYKTRIVGTTRGLHRYRLEQVELERDGRKMYVMLSMQHEVFLLRAASLLAAWYLCLAGLGGFAVFIIRRMTGANP